MMIEEDEYYDGPVPGSNVRPLFQKPIEVESVPRESSGVSIKVVRMAMDVLSFRLILLLATGASAGLFAGVVAWPDMVRLGAAAAFSGIVTLPLIIFYGRK